MFRKIGNCIILFTVTAPLYGGDIEGNVVIKRQMSRRTVTSPSSTYERGAAIELVSEKDDPLAFERAHVVVFLEGQLPSQPVAATLEQKNRRFTDDLVVVPVGSTVSFPNGDPIFHNVFSLSRPKVFDLGVYPKGQTRTVKMPTAGVVHVNCHLHPNMTATVLVTPTRWSTKADATGAFSLRDVPPGNYTIVAWHKSVGFFRRPLEVGPNATLKLTFILPFKDDGTTSTSHER